MTYIDVIVFLIGVSAGIFGAVAGGRTLISITLLMLLDIPLPIAVSSAKIGSTGYSVGSLYQFFKSGNIVRKYVVPLSLIAVLGGYVGANILIHMDKDIFVPMLGVIILLLIPLIVLKKNIGVVSTRPTILQLFLGILVYAIATIYGGAFGGMGLIVYISFLFFFKMTVLEAKATEIIPAFFLNLMAIWIYMKGGIVDWKLGILMFFGMLVGSYIGAGITIHKGNKRAKYLLVLFFLISALQLLYPYIRGWLGA